MADQFAIAAGVEQRVEIRAVPPGEEPENLSFHPLDSRFSVRQGAG